MTAWLPRLLSLWFIGPLWPANYPCLKCHPGESGENLREYPGGLDDSGGIFVLWYMAIQSLRSIRTGCLTCYECVVIFAGNPFMMAQHVAHVRLIFNSQDDLCKLFTDLIYTMSCCKMSVLNLTVICFCFFPWYTQWISYTGGHVYHLIW